MMDIQEKKAVKVGLNQDVLHGGLMYHVQTQVDPVHRREVVTQLFLAGAVVASTRTDFVSTLSGVVDRVELKERLRAIISEQHAAMVEELQAGRFEVPRGGSVLESEGPGPEQPPAMQPTEPAVQPTEPAAAIGPIEGVASSQVSGPSEMSQICESVIDREREVLGLGVFDLRADTLAGLHVVDAGWSREELGAIVGSGSGMYRYAASQGLDHLDESGTPEAPSEIFLAFGPVSQFISRLDERLLAVLVTKPGMTQGMGWAILRRVIEGIRSRLR
jgi:hypothetical protein